MSGFYESELNNKLQILNSLLEKHAEEHGTCSTLNIFMENDIWVEDYYRDYGGLEVRSNLLSLNSILNRSFRELHELVKGNPRFIPSPEQIKRCLRVFYRHSVGVDFILDQPVPFYAISNQSLHPFAEGSKEKEDTDILRLWLEIQNLFHGVRFWLDRNVLREYKDIMEVILNPEYSSKREYGYFIERCKQLKIWPMFNKGVWGKEYQCYGVLPLCWAELWHALENRVSAGICPICWKVYIVKPRGTNRKTCGSKDCRKEYIAYDRGADYNSNRAKERNERESRGEKWDRGRPLGSKTLRAKELLENGFNKTQIAKKMSAEFSEKIYPSQVKRWLKLK